MFASIGHTIVFAAATFKNCSRAWAEQRNFTYLAIAALGNHSVVKNISDELEALRPRMPDLTGACLVHMEISADAGCG